MLYNSGTMLLGFRRRALQLFDRTLALSPGFADAHMNRGARRDLKQPEEALDSHDRALALKPDFAAALNNRGNALRS
jgi:tetratricopeptide (TPR) repeat protein